jgi:hypothetical protein
MPWDASLTALNYVLAGLYPTVEESYRVVDEASIPRSFVAFQRRAIDNWHQILVEAAKREKLTSLLRVVRAEYPDNPTLLQIQDGELKDDRGPELGRDIPWHTDDAGRLAEKLMSSQSTLLPIGFLEVGLQRSRSVARITLATGEIGTCFLICDNAIVTNNHVIANTQQASHATVEFNYQQSTNGMSLPSVSFGLEPERLFHTSIDDDWTIVALNGDANRVWGAIDVTDIAIQKGDRVNIIQHPQGGPKQIALYHNIVTFADERRLQYLTDTLPGSSGSPVFDSHWQLVGLHHSGGWIVEPGTKTPVFRNEGISAKCVGAALSALNCATHGKQL